MVSSLANLPSRTDDGAVNVIVETPRGSRSKLKFDPRLGVMMLSRPLPMGITYPYDWGFIPSTKAADGDPVDAMLIWEDGSYPGVVIPCRLIGVLEVEQMNRETGRRERNDRIMAVPVKSVAMASVQSVDQLGAQTRAELQEFFVSAVRFEGKELVVLGWSGPDAAEALLR